LTGTKLGKAAIAASVAAIAIDRIFILLLPYMTEDDEVAYLGAWLLAVAPTYPRFSPIADAAGATEAWAGHCAESEVIVFPVEVRPASD